MDFRQLAHTALADAEAFASYVQKGLATLQNAQITAQLVRAVPELAPLVGKLAAAVPIVGELEAGLALTDFAVEHWGAVVAIGKIAHFAPADVLTYAPWQEDNAQE